MGRHAYDLANGDFTGYEYQVPIFVVTHQPPQSVTKGQNENLTIAFVTDGIESAIEQAKVAAGEKDVTIVGGASIAQQVINARLFDEIQIGIWVVPDHSVKDVVQAKQGPTGKPIRRSMGRQAHGDP